MYFEFFVEEPSAELVLRQLLPKLLPPATHFEIRVFEGKPDLLRKLPDRLRAYAQAIRSWDVRLTVLVDQDRDECEELKKQLEHIAAGAGLLTKSQAVSARFQVLNRIAVEELEAWFFGDIRALRAAYPRIPASLPSRSRFRDPDRIRGGTAETLERVLQQAGYHRGGLPKMAVAHNVAQHMDPEQNSSRSFRCFRDGIAALVGF